MILSMTGYGKAQIQLAERTYIIELRSLNSKQMDINMRIAPLFRERELDLRQLLTQRLERGKVDCAIYESVPTATNAAASVTPINMAALDLYVSQLQAYAAEKGMQTDVLALAMRLPDVTKPLQQDTLSDEEWQVLLTGVNDAICQFDAFRQQEGKALEQMFSDKLNAILMLLQQVEPLEGERISRIRSRIEDNLSLLSQEIGQATDRNRLEQEMIYYLEKLDITEEKVRLRNHIRYFFETMQDETTGVGKKLGFIAQEMGREINTLGSKSNHSEMQIIVVKMKDILEQIKEQVLNVL